ncbi:MAG: type II methionyl aminopeptidase [Nanoarchaeota archaeon]|nr:type II methionyl aminopeptidase [Nanoarchaeota archaeon]
MNKQKILQAGKIASEVKNYAKEIIKPEIPLLETAEKIEAKIVELGGKPAFPVNLSIDNIAAHYTPSHDDKTLAQGLLKIDIGVRIDGWIADTAFSIDLENSEENKKLIEASEKALKNVIEVFKENESLNKVGQKISETIETFGFSPIINLGGHGLGKEDFHAEPFIPNFDNKKNISIEKGLYAIEPFATTGSGRVHDGNPSGIYQLVSEKNIRSPAAREILSFVIEEYQTFPFCSRWLIKKFGTRALISLKQLEENGNLHQFSQLVESKGAKVSQAEDTILINETGIIVTTR